MHRGLDILSSGAPSAAAGETVARTTLVGIPDLAEPASHEDKPPSAPEPGASQIGLFDDIPRSIWTAFLAGWAGFFLLLWLFFAAGPVATFMVTIAILFGLVAFGLPIIMAKQAQRPDRPRIEVVHTRTGSLSVRAAAAQIAMIPGAVVIGLLGFILFAK